MMSPEAMTMKLSMEETLSIRVLRCIDVVTDLRNGVFTSSSKFLSYRVRLIDRLRFFHDVLQHLQRRVKKVSTRRVDKVPLSTYEGLYSICLEELIAAEGTLARLSKMMRSLSARLDGTIETVLREFERQGDSLNLCQQVRSLIEADSEIELVYVLDSALNGGHTKLLRFLTDTFNHDITALGLTSAATSVAGREDVARFLPAQEGDVNLKKEYDGNALQQASFAGHEKSVSTLLHQKVNVNAQGGYFGGALQAASIAGHTDIVKLLINKKAHVNNQGGHYGNALQAASCGGHQDIVQLLLDQQADVNAQGGYYGNALQAASSAGHADIVRLLFHKKANVIAQGGYFGNAFQAASFAGHEKIVKFLFHKKANVNAQGGYYGNALQAASFTGHEKIVKFLIDEGSDVNARGGHFGHALQAASFAGHEDIVRILLDHGADVNAKGGHFGHALQAASFAGHEDIVRILLDHGADVNAKGGLHRNALQAASSLGRRKIVRILFGRGAHFNAKGLHGSALQAALSSGHEDVVELLSIFEPGNDLRDRNSDTVVKQIAACLLENGFLESLLAKAFEGNTQTETFWQKLAQLIERYGEDLAELPCERSLRSAARYFASHRWHIIEAILSLCTSVKRTKSGSEAKVTKSRAAAPWNDRLDPTNPNSDVKLSRDEFREVYEYMTSTTAPLNSFLGSVCRLVYSNPLEAVRAELLEGIEFRPSPCRARFELNWRIEEYLDKEIVRTRSGEIDRRIVGSVLTLSGDARKCYANSCEVYMKWKWPFTYNILLEALALGCNDRSLGVYIMSSASAVRITVLTHSLNRC